MLAFLKQIAAARDAARAAAGGTAAEGAAAAAAAAAPPSVTLVWGLRRAEHLHKQSELLRYVEELGLELLVCFSQTDTELRVVRDVPCGRARLELLPGARARITTRLAQDEWPARLCSLLAGS